MKINTYITDWFDINSGVHKGDSLSSTLFINDLAEELNEPNLVILVHEIVLSILLFVDDIVILSENRQDLQKVIDCVNNWCLKWWPNIINHQLVLPEM